MKTFRAGLWSEWNGFKTIAMTPMGAARFLKAMCLSEKKYSVRGLSREIASGRWSVVAKNHHRPNEAPEKMYFEKVRGGYILTQNKATRQLPNELR